MKNPRIFIVNEEYKANYNVCLVNHSFEEKNSELISGGRLVTNEYEADKKLFIVNHEDLADIKITRENFPR